MLGPILAALNLVVVLYVAERITGIQQNQLEKKRLSIDLYNVWNAEALHQSRIAIDNFRRDAERNGLPIPTLGTLEWTRHSLSPDAFRLYHFFEKWAVLHSEGELDPRIMEAALGGLANWWDRHFFRRIRDQEDNIDIRGRLAFIQQQVFAQFNDPPAIGQGG